jgi:hypothetical protein
MKTTQDLIQEVKRSLVSFINADRWNNNSKMQIKDEMLWLVDQVASANLGFISEVATSVSKYERCSEKQAYWIAKGAVESNLIEKLQYLFS